MPEIEVFIFCLYEQAEIEGSVFYYMIILGKNVQLLLFYS